MRDFKFRIFFIESFLFFAALFFSLLTLKKNRPLFLDKKVIESSKDSLFLFIFYFFLATIFFLLITYFLKSKKTKRIIFKSAFLFAIFFGNLFLFLFWLRPIQAAILILILICIWLKESNVLIHDILMLFGIIGISTILGSSFSPKVFVYLLILLSIYDIIAVYKTKHMVKIASEMIESQAFLGIIIPKKLEGAKEKLEKISPGGDFIILGGGDIVLPLVFSLSVYLKGILASIIVAIFSLFGFFVNNLIFFSQKEQKPMPALPLISLFSLIGFSIVSCLSKAK